VILSSVVSRALPYFPTLSRKLRGFQEKVTEQHKMCVLIFSTTSVLNMSHSKKNSARCDHCWMLARSQYPEGPATGHLGTGLSWFPCVYKRMLRWFPTLPVATACFSCSPPDLNCLDPYFVFMFSLFHVYVHAL